MPIKELILGIISLLLEILIAKTPPLQIHLPIHDLDSVGFQSADFFGYSAPVSSNSSVGMDDLVAGVLVELGICREHAGDCSRGGMEVSGECAVGGDFPSGDVLESLVELERERGHEWDNEVMNVQSISFRTRKSKDRKNLYFCDFFI